MSAELAAELNALEAVDERDIDLDDLPEQLDWSNAAVAKFYRPRKQLVSLRVDQDVVAWFKKLAQDNEQGYLTLMNSALRAYVASKQQPRKSAGKR